MNYLSAVTLYFKKNPQNARILRRLMEWDGSVSVGENAKRMGTMTKNYPHILNLARKYHLGYSGLGWRYKDKPDLKKKWERLVKMRKRGCTYQRIGRLLKVSRQRVEQIIREGGYRWG